MFLGEYKHNIDYKGRVSVPKKFREGLAKEGPVLTKGLDQCLFLYPKESWKVLAERVKLLPVTGAGARAFSRYIFGSAVETGFDRLGRVQIPEYLREYASLSKEAVLVGVGERVEIWSLKRWNIYEKELEKRGEEIAERLKESGI
jgi:MraZ protein